VLHALVQKKKQNSTTHTCYGSERSINELSNNSAKYKWYQFFFDILSQLNHTNVARIEMLKSVRAFHSPDVECTVIQNCTEFERNYKPQDIISWYTRTSFFYIALNRSLRSENINHIFTFRYVISDLQRSLNELRMQQPPMDYDVLYRGQQMYLDEIKLIASKVGDLIRLTTFWAATASLRMAYFTAISRMRHTAPIEPVIFIVNIPPHIRHSVYVDISKFSSYQRGQQIIFPLYSLFRIEGIQKFNDTWHIELTLVDEDDQQFAQIMNSWTTSIGLRNFFSLPSVRKQDYCYDLSQDSTAFVRFQLLLDIILRLDRNDFARDEMIEACRTQFAFNPVELAKIDIFERTYVEKDAITWYTKDCFLYRLLNESLYIKSIDLIVKLRYFIRDLHNQLAEMHLGFLRSLPSGQSKLQLYRGLTMTMSELNEFRQNKNNLVSTNSFLSTTRDYNAALFFAGEGKVEDPRVSVIYEILVDTTVVHSVPFAAIEYQSIFNDEDEVLFSMAAVFRIGQTEEISERLWKIELTLTPSSEEEWNILTAHLKK
jgi:hypothetical protein